MSRCLLAFVLMFSLPPVLASDPGQPLDCSDWVFLESGLSCTVVADCSQISDEWCNQVEALPLQSDNLGGLLRHRFLNLGPVLCDGDGWNTARWEILRLSDGGEQLLGYMETRCGINGTLDNGGLLPRVVFDRHNGRLIAVLQSSCSGGASCPYQTQAHVVAFGGFSPIFEILQTYAPTSGPISFRVPYMPEGFPAADWFNTYYGDLANVGDWNQAEPLQCAYPASMPSVGDYLAVPESLPNPSPGNGRYYVTSVNYQGQTRYGRKAIGGVLSGRDPAVLPACSP